MSQPSNDPKSRNTIRRTIEDAPRHLPDRVRELPALAVRTTVVGVGRLLDAGERVRTEYGKLRRTGVGPTVDRLRRGGLRQVGASDRTEAPEHTSSRAETPPPTSAPAGTPPHTFQGEPRPAPDTRRSGETAEAPSHEELPVANYDQLTIASLRARLRYLTVSDLGTLLAHERTHQDRSDVVRMYENRILKLEREHAG